MLFVDHRMEVMRWPDGIGAGFQALEMVDRAVALDHQGFRKAAFLELPVDIAGEDEATARHFVRHGFQQVEAFVRHGGAVQIQPVAIKPPSQRRIPFEGGRRGDFLEADLRPTEGGIGLPEAAYPRKSGRPESTPMPAPAAMIRLSASSIRCAAALKRFSNASAGISVTRTPLRHEGCRTDAVHPADSTGSSMAILSISATSLWLSSVYPPLGTMTRGTFAARKVSMT